MNIRTVLTARDFILRASHINRKVRLLPTLRTVHTPDHQSPSLGEAANDPNNPFLEPATFIDPLADSTGCARDIPYLTQLGVNVIRVYSVDNTQDHDSCMKALETAGIYTM